MIVLERDKELTTVFRVHQILPPAHYLSVSLSRMFPHSPVSLWTYSLLFGIVWNSRRRSASAPLDR